jgi:hypothetical protein
MWAIIKKEEGEELEALIGGWEPFAVVIEHHWNSNTNQMYSMTYIYLRKQA